jgi:hypothetical protein
VAGDPPRQVLDAERLRATLGCCSGVWRARTQSRPRRSPQPRGWSAPALLVSP